MSEHLYYSLLRVIRDVMNLKGTQMITDESIIHQLLLQNEASLGESLIVPYLLPAPQALV